MKYTMKIYSQEVEKLIITEPRNRLMDKNFSKSDIIKELGDCLFYITAIANYLGDDLQAVADANMAKLKDRKKRDVIQGSGDNR